MLFLLYGVQQERHNQLLRDLERLSKEEDQAAAARDDVDREESQGVRVLLLAALQHGRDLARELFSFFLGL